MTNLILFIKLNPNKKSNMSNFLKKGDADLPQLVKDNLSYPIEKSEINGSLVTVMVKNKTNTVKLFGDFLKRFVREYNKNSKTKIYIVYTKNYTKDNNSVYYYDFSNCKIIELSYQNVIPTEATLSEIENLPDNSYLELNVSDQLEDNSNIDSYDDSTMNENYSKFSKREYAAMLLRVPDSGLAWLDKMIKSVNVK